MSRCIIDDLAVAIHDLVCTKPDCDWNVEAYDDDPGYNPKYYKLAGEIADDWDDVISPKAIIHILRRIKDGI